MNASGICDAAGPPLGRLVVPDAPARKDMDEKRLRAQRLESIGMLASGIAHDLNNVLCPIILAAPILREHATDPEDLRIITSLEKSAERGVDLVRQILSFAHGAASEKQIVEIKRILQEAASVASQTFPKNIRVEETVPDILWPIMADPTQIHQVLLNLCVNARDAMPDGGTLFLSAENCLLDEDTARKIDGGRAGAWIVLRVEDSGTGIPADTLSHVWEPFFTTKDEGKGTGLGLFTVRSIVENHNGFISLKTQPGHGTTFRVFLPAAEVVANEGSIACVQAKGERGNGELILVVDDEPQIRDLTAAMLSRNGYRVVTAGDGSEAVALFAARSNEIRVVITDLLMPNLDGAALARIVTHLNPHVKILAMSGLASAGQSGKSERYGGAFMFKPFKIQALLDSVSGLLHPIPVAEVA
jgi:two-component system cell cycle sensor histidine kinase/response regulator CckA